MLFGHQVAVALGDTYTVDDAVLDGPLFVAHLHPAGEILAVEQRDPSFLGLFESGLLGTLDLWQDGGQRQGQY